MRWDEPPTPAAPPEPPQPREIPREMIVYGKVKSVAVQTEEFSGRDYVELTISTNNLSLGAIDRIMQGVGRDTIKVAWGW